MRPVLIKGQFRTSAQNAFVWEYLELYGLASFCEFGSFLGSSAFGVDSDQIYM